MKIVSARAWALAGLAFILGRASVSLLVKGYHEVLSPPHLTLVEWVSLATIVVAFAWGEGWMALHRKWAPRVTGRIRTIDESTPLSSLLLAPLHAVGLVGTPIGTRVRSWAGVAAIVAAVLLVRILPQPWQGMIKLGVALALAMGLLSLVLRTVDGVLQARNLPPAPHSTR